MEEKVVERWMNAALKGDAEAQYRLGMLYKRGTSNFSKSPSDALMYLEMAAEQGHVKACYHLGVLYTFGDGPRLIKGTIMPGDGLCERDDEKAKKYFDMALRKLKVLVADGDADAFVWLSAMYKFGYGVEKDEGKARELLEQAADLGNPMAETLVG